MLNRLYERFLTGTGGKVLHWCRLHWIQTSTIVLLLFAGEQVATLPFGQISALVKKNPKRTAFMEQDADLARREGRRFKILQKWIPLSEISRDAVNAVIVAEDGTFWTNEGFDWFELRESIGRDMKEGRAVRGASTITQQLVKNLYLSPSKNPLRKMKEWVLTWWMNRELSKPRILELYMNVIEWGSGVYGIEAASWFYFGKPASLLSKVEAARLAAIIPNPEDHRADSDSEYVIRRSDLILERMEARGY
jgi:monofunctional biosynthetic peptidoglycan transglycosylase